MLVICNYYSQTNPRRETYMNTKKTLFTTAALGAAYLLRNKDARNKVMNGIQSFTSQIRAKRNS